MREPVCASDAPESPEEINLTPMLDVVFIMLIFFLVVASFTTEHGLDLNQEPPSNADPLETRNIVIAIEEDNEIWLGQHLVDPRALRANIARRIAEEPDAAVIIQADERSANKTLVRVMDASRQAGVYRLSLATSDQ